MRLSSVRLRNVGPFADTTVRFSDPEAPARDAPRDAPGDAPRDAPEDGAAGAERAATDVAPPRPVTVLFGGDGTGKTTLLSALSLTRPGYALPPLPASRDARPSDGGEPPCIAVDWMLGDDDPLRPHPLVVTSPTAVFDGEPPEAAAFRRREQAMFDRRAQTGGGFVFVAFSGARWFSRAANMLTTPERTVLKHDVRAPATFDDPTRADLARETKQVLAYAAISRALAASRERDRERGPARGRRRTRDDHEALERFDAALTAALDVLLEPFGFAYDGVSPVTLEPEARRSRDGSVVPFDALPRAARHLVAFGALSLRALFAAYPDAADPRTREGVVAIDDVESQQDPATLRVLVPVLRRALPNVQWILTTASRDLATACASNEVVALRREIDLERSEDAARDHTGAGGGGRDGERAADRDREGDAARDGARTPSAKRGIEVGDGVLH
jgi:hypothetical protein